MDKGNSPMRLVEGNQAMNLEANFAVMGKAPRNHEWLLQEYLAVQEYLKAILLQGAGRQRLLPEQSGDFQIGCLVEEAVRRGRNPVGQNPVGQLRLRSSDL